MPDNRRDSLEGKCDCPPGKSRRRSVADHPAVGIWKDRADMEDVSAYVRRLRRPRYEHLFRAWREERKAEHSGAEEGGQ